MVDARDGALRAATVENISGGLVICDINALTVSGPWREQFERLYAGTRTDYAEPTAADYLRKHKGSFTWGLVHDRKLTSYLTFKVQDTVIGDEKLAMLFALMNADARLRQHGPVASCLSVAFAGSDREASRALAATFGSSAFGILLEAAARLFRHRARYLCLEAETPLGQRAAGRQHSQLEEVRPQDYPDVRRSLQDSGSGFWDARIHIYRIA
jgi:hypothetical protein